MVRTPRSNRFASLEHLKQLLEELRAHGLSDRDILPFTTISNVFSIHKWRAGLSSTGPDNLERLTLAQDMAAATATELGSLNRPGHIAVFFRTAQPALKGLSPGEFIKIHGIEGREKLQIVPSHFAQAVKDGVIRLSDADDPRPAPIRGSAAKLNEAKLEELRSEDAAGLAESLVACGFSSHDIGAILPSHIAQMVVLHRVVALNDRQSFQMETAVNAAQRLAELHPRDKKVVRNLLMSRDSRNGLGGFSIIDIIAGMPADKLGQRRAASRVKLAVEQLHSRIAIRA